MLVHLDTEFSDLKADAKLISIGLVHEDGSCFYAELADTYYKYECSDFVCEVVLPLLENGSVRMPLDTLTIRLKSWLESFNEPIQLATDSMAWDWKMLGMIFNDATWPSNVDKQPFLLTMNYIENYDVFVKTIEQNFASGSWRQHHALDDAKVNRIGWIAARDFK